MPQLDGVYYNKFKPLISYDKNNDQTVVHGYKNTIKLDYSTQIDGDLTVDGNTHLNSLNLNNLSVNNGLTVAGSSQLNGLTVAGSSQLNGLTVAGSSQLNGLTVAGKTQITGDINVDGQITQYNIPISSGGNVGNIFDSIFIRGKDSNGNYEITVGSPDEYGNDKLIIKKLNTHLMEIANS